MSEGTIFTGKTARFRKLKVCETGGLTMRDHNLAYYKRCFLFYKFCQSPILTILSNVYAYFSVLTCAHDFPWWASILIGLIATRLWLLPVSLLPILHPYGFMLTMLLAIIFSLSNIDVFFYILVGVSVLYVFRFTWMVVYSMRNPQLTTTFDLALRYGYNPFKNAPKDF